MTEQMKEFGAACVVLFCGTAVIALIFWYSNRRVESVNPAPTASSPVGSEQPLARLAIPGLNDVAVASDDRSLDELITALVRRDESGIESLIASGNAFRVNNNTRIRVLKIGSGAKTRVRIMEGENAMKEGWVAETWVKQ
jgi:hypothetical protein